MAISSSTQMFQEAAEAPECVARQQLIAGEAIQLAGAALRKLSPRFVATIARGSSDHAATYGKYVIETVMGVPVVSYAPSVSSVYEAHSSMKGAACIAISQSGKSPDIVAALETARSGGALTIALVNDLESPLAHVAEHAIPLCAAPETAVAATKSYLASLSMLARIVASWGEDAGLNDALDALPRALRQSWELDWSKADHSITNAQNMVVLGRGQGLGIAQEAALKLKETCRIHAEAYSAAEVLHGPAAIVRSGFPVLAFSQNDASAGSVRDTCTALADMGANVFLAGANAAGTTTLPSLDFDARLQPILFAQSFYRLVNRCAVALGENPDSPPNLRKVTETV